MPQIILLDLKLPKVDGFEVLNRVRSEEITKFLPVVILTTSNEDQDRIRGYGPVKEKAVRDAKARYAQLAADLANPPPAPRQIAAE